MGDGAKAWVLVGLLAWTAVFILWMTGPHDCTPPDRNQEVHCR